MEMVMEGPQMVMEMMEERGQNAVLRLQFHHHRDWSHHHLAWMVMVR